MGCGASKEPEAPARTLVLLGSGECGKTTMFKQIQILHGTGIQDREAWIDSIQQSPKRSMQTLLKAVDQRQVVLEPAMKECAARVLAGSESSSTFTLQLAEDIQKLWQTEVLRELAAATSQQKGGAVDLDDNAAHFLNKVVELAAPSYSPTTEDILKVRDPTRTIEAQDFKYNKARVRVIDVGGQRMERPKWNLTGDITAVIFVASLIEYDQVLREDVKMNRLRESLNLFDIACNRRYPNLPILLFLNKRDLFEKKIQQVDLSCCFPTYKGGLDYDAAIAFIEYRFTSLVKDKTKPIYVFKTTATETENMQVIIKSLMDIVERDNLAKSGFS